jgi:transposase-like protein
VQIPAVFTEIFQNPALAARLISLAAVTRKTAQQLFPCPFCNSGRIRVIGGSRTFLYYNCDDCSEAWTAMNLVGTAPKRPQLLGDLPNPTIH